MIKIDNYKNIDSSFFEPYKTIFLSDKNFSINFYRALCNQTWINTKRNLYIDRSWRGAGRMVAEIRNIGEDYLDYYISEKEGEIDPEIEKFLNDLDFFVIEDVYTKSYADNGQISDELLDEYMSEEIKKVEIKTSKKYSDIRKNKIKKI